MQQQFKLAWEVKLVFVLAVYCLFKFFSGSVALVWISRLVFVAGHVFLYMATSRFNASIFKKATWTLERKEKARGRIQKDIVRPLLLRAAVVGLIHWKVGMNPPLLVSVIMGVFSLYESKSLIEKED